MAEIKHQLHPDVVINTGTAVKQGSGWRYEATQGGTTFTLPSAIPFSPDELIAGIGDDNSPVYSNLDSVLRRLEFVSSGPEGMFKGTIGPALQRTPANVLGAPVDIMNIAAQGLVDAPINVIDWAFKGFQGEMPSKRYLSSEVPLGGSESIARGMQAVGDVAREGISATEEAGLNVAIPEWIPVAGGQRVGVRTLLEPFAFDTTPDERDKARQYASLIAQIAAAAPMEGSLIAKLAVQLAKTTENVTRKAIYDAISEMQVNSPTTAALYEGLMGGGVGSGMVTSLEALEAAWPDAPQWAKNTIMAKGGILIPIGGVTAASTAWDVGIKTPIVSIPLRIARGAAESLTVSGAERAAARAIQTFGSDWKNRSQILGVTGQLKLALKEGREMDPLTRISFTTPQLARNEARLLEAQLNVSSKDMSPSDISAQEQLIYELRRFANFQEGHLKSLSEGGGIGAAAYAKYSERLLQRRDSIFQALDEGLLKMDLGGRSDFDVEPAVIEADYAQGLATGNFEFNINRRRAVQDGRLGNVDPEQIQAMTTAYDGLMAKLEDATRQSLDDAMERVDALRQSMPENMSAQDKTDFNTWVLREIETSYREIDALEDVLWNGIGGMKQPKTESYVTPDGQDLGPQLTIDDVPIGEYFAEKVASLGAGEEVNQSKWLWKLAGRTALVEQAAKGTGADAEKIARQNLEVTTAENRLNEVQTKLDRATADLNQLQEPRPTKVRAGLYNYKGFVIERITRAMGGDDQWNITGPGQTAADDAANTLADSVALIDTAYKPTQATMDRAVSKWETSGDAVQKAQNRLAEAKAKLEISSGQGVEFEGSPVNVLDEIYDSSALGVRNVDEAQVGRSPQELQNIISILKREQSFEQGRSVRNPAKIAAIGSMIDDLQRAIPENFEFIDTTLLDAARRMTATKKTLFERGDIGRLRGFNTRGEANVSIENISDKLVPVRGQSTNLRELEGALSARYETMAGDNTPFRLVTGDDGVVRPELDTDFNLEKYAAAPPPPFQMIQVNGGRSRGLRVAEGTQPSEANIRAVRETLWDRFKDFGAGDKFDSAAAEKWLSNNADAVAWLRKATGEDTGFENLAAAEQVVQSIKGGTAKNLDDTVNTLREAGAFNDEFTEAGYRMMVKENDRRAANMNSAAIFLDNPDPLTMGPDFLKEYLRNPQILGDTLKVLDNGLLPDGSNPALEGFKRAVAEAIIKRGLTDGTGGTGTRAAQDARELSASLGRDVTVWDPAALSGMANDARFGRLLGELYGDGGAETFRQFAEGARLQSIIGDSATPGVRMRDLVSDEWAGNLGRVAGGWVAQRTPISSLVLTGVGRRYSMAAIANVRGNAVDLLLVDFLMNPKLADAAITKYPVRPPNANDDPASRIKLWAQKKFIDDNARRIERIGRTPSVLYEIGDPYKYEGSAEETDQQSSLELAPPTMALSNRMPPPRPRVSGSSLDRVNPLQFAAASPPPQQFAGASTSGPPNPEIMAGLDQLGMPLFASKGGLASIKKKKKKSQQMVY